MASSPNSTGTSLPAWLGFVFGLLGGFAVSLGLLGIVVGYSMGGGVRGTAAVENPPPAPSAPAAPAPTPAPDKPVPPADPAKDHILGNPNAKVSVIEYSDFECPFCKRHYDTINQLVAKYKPDQVNIVYRHFPLSFHQNAQKEAEASECVAELGGNDAFWKFHNYIFEKTTSNGTGFALDQLPVAAKAAGVDEAKFKTCLDSGKYAQLVQDEENEGVSVGVQGTPANFIVNNQTKETKSISGAVPLSNFQSVIDPMLK